ncbi:hypothetical protein D7V86_07810 [bacterium D16-51]|nr:hypothetical protein D7V96_09455 [bacterium D16-59]RKI60736.1 hypothetical protein D7V86_07810 [bacterium D16-51]
MENKNNSIYRELLQQQEAFHQKNVKSIRTGIKCVIFVPLFFLALVFLTDSNKVIFLTLWIISMFIISAYLIYIEYMDFQVQELIAKITQNAGTDAKPLIGGKIDEFESSVLELLKQWEESLPPRKRIEELLSARRLSLSGEQKDKLLTQIPEKEEEEKHP